MNNNKTKFLASLLIILTAESVTVAMEHTLIKPIVGSASQIFSLPNAQVIAANLAQVNQSFLDEKTKLSNTLGNKQMTIKEMLVTVDKALELVASLTEGPLALSYITDSRANVIEAILQSNSQALDAWLNIELNLN